MPARANIFNFKIRYVNGEETNTPGSTSTDTVREFKKNHEWLTAKINAERYFNGRGTLRIGCLVKEFFYSTLFNNYTSSILYLRHFSPHLTVKQYFWKTTGHRNI